MEIGETLNRLYRTCVHSKNYNWAECDDAVNFANDNNMKFKFHNIFWTKYDKTPDWVDDLNAVELEEFCYQYIDELDHRAFIAFRK